MKKIPVILAFLFLASGANAADVAGWDKTTWNMSKEELTALYKDRIKEVRDNAGIDERMILHSITAGDRSFDVELILEKNKLTSVRLLSRVSDLPQRDYNGIKDLLIQKYGHPNTQENKSHNSGMGMKLFLKEAKWFKGGTTIVLTVMGDCRKGYGGAYECNGDAVIRYVPSKDLSGL